MNTNTIKNTKNFMLLVSVNHANPNGDPRRENEPRVDAIDNKGFITDVCIKHKVRTYQSIATNDNVFVVAQEDSKEPTCKSLQEKYKKTVTESGKSGVEALCDKYIDVRQFGAVCAFSSTKSDDSVALSLRGPITIQQAYSVDPVELETVQITKCINGADAKDSKGKDTMGTKKAVRYGLYVIKGSVNAYFAEKTGLTEEDVEKFKTALLHMFDFDGAVARPDGAIVIEKAYWWEHNGKTPNVPLKKLYDTVQIKKKDGVDYPASFADYEVTVTDNPTVPVTVLFE